MLTEQFLHGLTHPDTPRHTHGGCSASGHGWWVQASVWCVAAQDGRRKDQLDGAHSDTFLSRPLCEYRTGQLHLWPKNSSLMRRTSSSVQTSLHVSLSTLLIPSLTPFLTCRIGVVALPVITPGGIRRATVHTARGIPPGTQSPLREDFVVVCLFEGASNLVNGILSKDFRYLEIK